MGQPAAKERLLAWLKESPGYLTGEVIGARLQVTRAAVWKMVQALRREGYPVEAVTRRGYRLSSSPDVLNEAEIQEVLRGGSAASFVRSVQFAAETGSTNQMAKQAADLDAPSASLFVAARQTAGRGRRGRSWLSDHEQGLWFSLLLRPQASPARLTTMTLWAGLCVASALNQTLGVPAGIKWPNDILSKGDGRKLGGILTEMVVEDQAARAVIIGVGLNVNTRDFPPEIADTATSLYLAGGRKFRRAEVLSAVLAQFANRYPAYLADSSWLASYQMLCLTLGREVLVQPASGIAYPGWAVEIDPAGELVVEDRSGCRHTVLSGDVSIRSPIA